MTVECMSDDQGPATLYSGDVARLFKVADKDEYKRARREFIRASDIDFRQIADVGLRATMRCLFEEWFAYDRPVDESGTTPFDIIARALFERDDGVCDREYEDFREFSATNFAAWFWIRDASASSRRMTVENMADGRDYEVYAGDFAARCDGARGGSMLVRIARPRGTWRMCGNPSVFMREPNDEDGHRFLSEIIREWDPGFPELVGALFAPHPGMMRRDGTRIGGAAAPSALRPVSVATPHGDDPLPRTRPGADRGPKPRRRRRRRSSEDETWRR